MTDTYQTGHPIWCAGCGHFGVQGFDTACDEARRR